MVVTLYLSSSSWSGSHGRAEGQWCQTFEINGRLSYLPRFALRSMIIALSMKFNSYLLALRFHPTFTCRFYRSRTQSAQCYLYTLIAVYTYGDSVYLRTSRLSPQCQRPSKPKTKPKTLWKHTHSFYLAQNVNESYNFLLHSQLSGPISIVALGLA